MDHYKIIHNYFLVKRSKPICECIISCTGKIQNIKSTFPTIRSWNCRRVYVYHNGIFDVVLTYSINVYVNQLFNEKIQISESYPIFELTKLPQIVPVTFQEKDEWEDIQHICILPFHGWDFYEIDWILQRWSCSLNTFDYDEFLITPSYPKDIYNHHVPPDVVFFTIGSYVEQFSLNELKHNFFSLYLFYRDDLGKKMLEFFYDCLHSDMDDKVLLYKKIHSIWHSTPEDHEYRLFLFFYSKCISSRNKFKIQLYISQYLSFYGMFLCPSFIKERQYFIWKGITSRFPEFRVCLSDETDIFRALCELETFLGRPPTWVCREHLKDLQHRFWKFMYVNWTSFTYRNIYLFDSRSFNYVDNQFCFGYSLTSYFPKDWSRKFGEKDFSPVRRKTTVLKKK